MATHVIDRFETIEVEETQYVVLATVTRIFHRLMQATLEFAAVHQACQRIVAGLVRHLSGNTAGFSDVVQQHHATLRLGTITSQRCHGQFHHALRTILLAQYHGAA